MKIRWMANRKIQYRESMKRKRPDLAVDQQGHLFEGAEGADAAI